MLWTVLILLAIALWCFYWGGYTVATANHNLVKGTQNELPIPRQLMWWVIGAISGPIGPALTVIISGGHVFERFEYPSLGGRTLENLRTLFVLMWRVVKDCVWKLSSRKRDFLKKIEEGDIEAVRNFLQRGMSPNIKHADGKTALMIALEGKHKNIVRLLLEAEADTGATDAEGRTAFVDYSMPGLSVDLNVIKLMLGAGVGVNSKNARGSTILVKAVYQSNEDLIVFLLKNGADVNARDNNGYTALFHAIERARSCSAGDVPSWDLRIIKNLIVAGADLSLKSKLSGNTVWDRATTAKDEKTRIILIKALLSSGQKPDFAMCVSCHKALDPFSTPGGMLVGTIREILEMPGLQDDNALVCDACKSLICMVCLGKKASKMGVREFVCTKCGHRPLKTIFRA